MEQNQLQPQVDMISDLANGFQVESDRAASVLAAAYLDHLLGELIAATMTVDHKEVENLLYQGGNGPLASFAVRIDTAYCLGLLNKDERRDLHIIRKIRNDFAHKLSAMSFEGTEGIANRCREMKSAKASGSTELPRECFINASIRLMVDIILRIREEQNTRRNGLSRRMI